MHFVGKPKPVVCHINSCKFHRTCYTSTASAVFWQEDACQNDHTSSLNSADLSPKELNSLTTSIPSKKSGAPAFEELFGLRNFLFFFFFAMGIHSVFNHSNTWNLWTLCYLWTQKIHVWSLFSSSNRGFFGPISTSCFSKNKSDAEESDKEFSRSGTIFWRKTSTIFQIKNPPSTLAKVKQLQWKNPIYTFMFNSFVVNCSDTVAITVINHRSTKTGKIPGNSLTATVVGTGSPKWWFKAWQVGWDFMPQISSNPPGGKKNTSGARICEVKTVKPGKPLKIEVFF